MTAPGPRIHFTRVIKELTDSIHHPLVVTNPVLTNALVASAISRGAPNHTTNGDEAR